MADTPVVVLASGHGSNLQALIEARDAGTLPIAIRAVLSNRADAFALTRAAQAGIAPRVIDERSFGEARRFSHAVADALDEFAPALVVLAGFMRILHADCVARYAGRMINLHPSLLPRHPGLHTHRRVLEAGDREHGASVHFVTPELDAGPLIIQRRVAVTVDDTVASLAEKVHALEHRILPTAVGWFAAGRLSLVAGRVRLDGRRSPAQGLAPVAAPRDTAGHTL